MSNKNKGSLTIFFTRKKILKHFEISDFEKLETSLRRNNSELSAYKIAVCYFE